MEVSTNGLICPIGLIVVITAIPVIPRATLMMPSRTGGLA
jgi:hypothetical protein